MHVWIRMVTLVVLLSAISACAADAPPSLLPPAVKTILDNAPQLELLSLDPYPYPDRAKDKHRFHTYRVLGSTQLTGKSKQSAISTIVQATRTREDMHAACFNPRHGIRATYQDQTVDLVICFECFRMHVVIGGESASLPLTKHGHAELDALLVASKVPLAPRD